jgi:hypothetical protein
MAEGMAEGIWRYLQRDVEMFANRRASSRASVLAAPVKPNVRNLNFRIQPQVLLVPVSYYYQPLVFLRIFPADPRGFHDY